MKGLGPDGAGKAEVVGPALELVLVLPNEKVGAFEVDEVGLAAGAPKEKVAAVGVLPVDPNPADEPAVLAVDVVCPTEAFLLGMPRIFLPASASCDASFLTSSISSPSESLPREPSTSSLVS